MKSNLVQICRWLSEWWLVFVLLGLILLCVMGVGFENTCTVSRKWNKDTGSVQDFIFWFCDWCNSRELGGRVNPRFPCLTPVMYYYYYYYYYYCCCCCCYFHFILRWLSTAFTKCKANSCQKLCQKLCQLTSKAN